MHLGMMESLVTVEQAAEHLRLHPKTVLRYIRDGRLPATRVGKSYRIARASLEALAGTDALPQLVPSARATCIVDIPALDVATSERLATFLQAASMAKPRDTPSIELQTAYDPLTRSMKVVVISSPSNVASVLDMLEARLGARV